jgi:hypothetical protein
MIREQSSRVHIPQPLRLTQAECRQEVLNGTADPDWWFAEPSEAVIRGLAISICRRCPIREACAMEAIGAKIPYGIFGGMGVKERARWKPAA